MPETRLSKFAVIQRLSLLGIFGRQLGLPLSLGILVFRGPLLGETREGGVDMVGLWCRVGLSFVGCE